jgi:hypothetical protein
MTDNDNNMSILNYNKKLPFTEEERGKLAKEICDLININLLTVTGDELSRVAEATFFCYFIFADFLKSPDDEIRDLYLNNVGYEPKMLLRYKPYFLEFAERFFTIKLEPTP